MKIKVPSEVRYYIHNGVVYKVENGEVDIPDDSREIKEEKQEAKKNKRKEE